MESDCLHNTLRTRGYTRFYFFQTNYLKISQMPSNPAVDWRVWRLKRQHVVVTERERESPGPCRLCACTYATALLFGWLSVSSAT